MFTILWKAMNGSQMLYSANGDVSFTPANLRQNTNPAPQGNCVCFEDAKGHFVTLDSGEVIVMNEKGATVAKHVLLMEEVSAVHRAA